MTQRLSSEGKEQQIRIQGQAGSAPQPCVLPQTPAARGPQAASDGHVTIYRADNFFVDTAQHRALGLDVAAIAEEDTPATTLSWTAKQQQRFSLADTHKMPRIELFNPVLKRDLPLAVWLEALLVTLVLAVIAYVHALNMFSYPQFSVEEGSYVANAWAIGHGTFEPYAFLYNQVPLGWIQIAAWMQLIHLCGEMGAMGAMGAMDSARILMLLFALGSALLLYLIVQRVSGSRGAALLAMSLSALSPLGLTYQREVLLENIGIFWLLLSLLFLVAGNSQLRTIVFAALALGIAILSKEIMLIFFPAMLYGVWLHTTRFQRKFASVAFGYIVLSLCSTFVLLAVLKGELLPGYYRSHLQLPSLLGGLVMMVHPASADTLFQLSWAAWQHDSLPLQLISAGAIAINVLGGQRNRLQWFLALLLLSYWAYLLLSGLAYPSYIVLELPLMLLNIAMALNTPLRWLCRRVGWDLARMLIIFSLIGALVPFDIQQAAGLLTLRTATAQVQALQWVRLHVPSHAVVVMNTYLFADLHQPVVIGKLHRGPYNYAFVYSNAVADPDIRDVCLHNNWNAIDYLVLDNSMVAAIRSDGSQMVMLQRALSNTELLQVYTADSDAQVTLRIYKVLHDPLQQALVTCNSQKIQKS